MTVVEVSDRVRRAWVECGGEPDLNVEKWRREIDEDLSDLENLLDLLEFVANQTNASYNLSKYGGRRREDSGFRVQVRMKVVNGKWSTFFDFCSWERMSESSTKVESLGEAVILAIDAILDHAQEGDE